MLKTIFACLFWDTELTVGFVYSSPLVLRKSGKVKTLIPNLHEMQKTEMREFGNVLTGFS
jgi:hypothetical protein